MSLIGKFCLFGVTDSEWRTEEKHVILKIVKITKIKKYNWESISYDENAIFFNAGIIVKLNGVARLVSVSYDAADLQLIEDTSSADDYEGMEVLSKLHGNDCLNLCNPMKLNQQSCDVVKVMLL